MRMCFIAVGICLLLSSAALAQGTGMGSISGVVVSESSKQPLESAGIVLLSLPDSTLVTGTMTDRKGTFRIDKIAPGQYFLHLSMIGYGDALSQPVSIDSMHPSADIGSIALTTAAIRLGEVVVTAKRPAFNNAIDRKVYNVQQDALGKTGSASDLLQSIPSVQVDIAGTVSLRGSENVLILVNDRPSPLMGKNRAEVLQQMPGSSIERIEVITNPSAKFKPDGTSGIINIVLKKDATPGMNAMPSASVGDHERLNVGVTLNYKPGPLNVYGSYGYRHDQRNSFMTDRRSQPDSSTGGRTRYDESLRSHSQPISHVGTLGMDWRLAHGNSFGVSGDFRRRGFTRRETSTKVFADAGGHVTSDYARVRVDNESEDEAGLSAYLEHDFKQEDRKLRMEVNIARSPETEDNHYTNIYSTPSTPVSYDNVLIKQTEDQKQVTVDYSSPLTEHSNLEVGYSGDFNRTDMRTLGEFFDPAQQRFITDSATSNHFAYRETIHAAYGTFANTFGSLSAMAGLRMEEALLNTHLAAGDAAATNDYFKLYPTLHLAYAVSEGSELQLNYSRRANRPEGEDLNPFPENVDPRNIRVGNPRLRPEMIHSIELGCRQQRGSYTAQPSLFYRRKYDGMTAVTRALNDSTLLTTRENLATDQSAGVELLLGVNAGSIFSTNASGSGFYEVIDASNLGFGAKKSTVTWSGTLNGNLTLASGTMLQLNSTYRSSRLTPQGKYLASVVFNVGARQELLNDKLSLTLTVSDVFKTLNRKMELDTPWLKESVTTSRDSRVAYLGVSYRFGRPPKKAKEKSLEYDNGL
jgi:outer membrane receptor protein involved in Fe transport